MRTRSGFKPSSRALTPTRVLFRMDENYNILPHGVNFQDAVFPDTADNRRTFSSLFQFSNCSQGNQPFHTFSPEWDTQEDSRVSHRLDWIRHGSFRSNGQKCNIMRGQSVAIATLAASLRQNNNMALTLILFPLVRENANLNMCLFHLHVSMFVADASKSCYHGDNK